MEQLQGEMAQAQKEKAEAMLECERQIIEMTSTLEKYTDDHQKLLAQKDKEIEELHNKNVQLDAVIKVGWATTEIKLQYVLFLCVCLCECGCGLEQMVVYHS